LGDPADQRQPGKADSIVTGRSRAASSSDRIPMHDPVSDRLHRENALAACPRLDRSGEGLTVMDE
jgi:hypothetical protein